MSSRAHRAKQEEAFTLSMVDLFGCGFIASIFLFILNIVQPQIEAAQASNSFAAVAASGRRGGGMSGPVFLSVKSRAPLHFTQWPVAGGPPDLISPGVAGKDDRFKYVYDQVVPDGSSLNWPLRVSLCASSAPNMVDCSAQDVAQTNDIVVRVTSGNSTAAAYFVSHPIAEPVEVSFPFMRDLLVRSTRQYAHQVSLELSPARRGNAAYRSLATFFSPAPFVASMGWSGPVAERTLSSKRTQAVMIPAPNCWVFAKSDSGPDLLSCPADAKVLIKSVGEEPWRSDIFAQTEGSCTFPFDQGFCQPKVGAAPSNPTVRLGIDHLDLVLKPLSMIRK